MNSRPVSESTVTHQPMRKLETDYTFGVQEDRMYEMLTQADELARCALEFLKRARAVRTIASR